MKKLQVLLFVLSLLVTFFTLQAQQEAKDYIIDTVVGTAQEAGYTGDSIIAVDAHLYTPMSVTCDEFGRIYIADTQNNRIRVVDLSEKPHVIYSIAGNGIFGYNGDDKYGTKCTFAFPMGVAVQTSPRENKKAENAVQVYISDTRNNLIRMLNEYNIMTRVGGTGRFGYSGDGGPAEKAYFKWPSQICLDEAGNVYIADTYNHRIRVIYRKEGSTIAGNGGQIKNPKRDYIYCLAGTGIKGYGGDGKMADQANLNTPWDICAVGGTLYIADKGNHVIRKIDSSGIITTVAGIPGRPGYYGDILAATEEKLHTPYGVWSDGNDVYACDTMNSRIRKFPASSETIETFCGFGIFGFGGDGALAKESMISHPVDIFGTTKGPLTGQFFFVDLQNQVVRVIKQETTGAGQQGGAQP